MIFKTELVRGSQLSIILVAVFTLLSLHKRASRSSAIIHPACSHSVSQFSSKRVPLACPQDQDGGTVTRKREGGGNAAFPSHNVTREPGKRLAFRVILLQDQTVLFRKLKKTTWQFPVTSSNIGCGRNSEIIINKNNILLKVIDTNFRTSQFTMVLNFFFLYIVSLFVYNIF